MVTSVKKVKVKWDPVVERKLIGIWADILEETNRRMFIQQREREREREVQVLIRSN